MVKVLPSGKQRKRGQPGFTLAELVIAIAISAILVVGCVELLSHMVVATARNRANTMAMLQVQYVGFWITEDMVQAGPDGVSFGNTNDTLAGAQIGYPYPLRNNPLDIYWKEWGGVAHHIEYRLAPDPEDSSNYILMRNDITGGNSTVIVGEYLDPDLTVYSRGNGTAVLKLDVTANVDGKIASRTYEINPRSKS